MLEGQVNVVEALEQAITPKRVHLERGDVALFLVGDNAAFQINRQLIAGRSVARAIRSLTSSSGKVTGRMPFLKQLL